MGYSVGTMADDVFSARGVKPSAMATAPSTVRTKAWEDRLGRLTSPRIYSGLEVASSTGTLESLRYLARSLCALHFRDEQRQIGPSQQPSRPS